MVNAGVKGFKCFLVHSGVDEFPSVTESDVRLAMEQMQGTDVVFLVMFNYYDFLPLPHVDWNNFF